VGRRSELFYMGSPHFPTVLLRTAFGDQLATATMCWVRMQLPTSKPTYRIPTTKASRFYGYPLRLIPLARLIRCLGMGGQYSSAFSPAILPAHRRAFVSGRAVWTD